jgi:hypothetical protein
LTQCCMWPPWDHYLPCPWVMWGCWQPTTCACLQMDRQLVRETGLSKDLPEGLESNVSVPLLTNWFKVLNDPCVWLSEVGWFSSRSSLEFSSFSFLLFL